LPRHDRPATFEYFGNKKPVARRESFPVLGQLLLDLLVADLDAWFNERSRVANGAVREIQRGIVLASLFSDCSHEIAATLMSASLPHAVHPHARGENSSTPPSTLQKIEMRRACHSF
jgi:hypothetical protein